MGRSTSNVSRAARHYGISRTAVRRMTERGACDCCGRTRGNAPFNIDHNHKTGKVRGLLCSACNVGIIATLDNHFKRLRLMRDFLELSPLPVGDYLGADPAYLAGRFMPGICECCGEDCDSLGVGVDFISGRVVGLVCNGCRKVLPLVLDTTKLEMGLRYLECFDR